MIDKIKQLLFAQERSRRVWIAGLIVAAGTLFAVAVCAFYVYVLGKPFYPYGTIFSPWPDTFGDIMFPLNVVLGTMEPYKYFGHNYFPLAYVLLWPLKVFPGKTGGVFFVFSFLIFMLAYNRINLKNIPGGGWAAIVFTFLCYPVFFLAERANIEMFMFMIFVGFVWSYRKQFFYAAACLLAISISLKLYPAVFLILFAKDKKFKPIFLTCFLSIVFFYVGLSLTGNDLQGLLTNLAYFNERYAVSASGVGGAHSFFALLRAPITVMLDEGTLSFELYKQISKAMAFPYMIFCFSLFAIASLIVILKEKSFWKNLFILTLCSVWLPYVSYDYTLIALLVPFFLFTKSTENEKDAILYSILFGLFFIPMNWYWLCGSEAWRANIGVVIRTILLGFMLLYIMFKDFSAKELWRDLKLYLSDVLPFAK